MIERHGAGTPRGGPGRPGAPAPGGAADAPKPLLEIDHLAVGFLGPHGRRDSGMARAVDGLSLAVAPGEVVAMVGESGCGKTMTALAVMGLLPPEGFVSGGDIRFHGRSLMGLDERRYRRLRGGAIAMVFQDPLSSLHPSFRVGHQIAETLLTHGTCRRRRIARARAVELLALVGVPDPHVRARAYPHQLSGGLRQRAMIAMAIANRPRLLIADEPTTALDVTVQAQVLEVLRVARRETGAALLLITHDFGVVAGMADRVAVVYAGKVVEEGTCDDVLTRPRHPYTIGLLASVPRLDTVQALRPIPGLPPNPRRIPPGCAFHPRCPLATTDCREAIPHLLAVVGAGAPQHRCACWRASEAPALLPTTAAETSP